jgi:hypothetical protein
MKPKHYKISAHQNSYMKLTEYGFELLCIDEDNPTIERFRSVKLAEKMLCISRSEILPIEYDMIKYDLLQTLTKTF